MVVCSKILEAGTGDVDQLRASVQKLTGLRTTLKPTGDEPAARHIVGDSNV
jgi:hypothetical protein